MKPYFWRKNISSKLIALLLIAVATMLPYQSHAAALSFTQAGDGTISALLDTGPCPIGPIPGTTTTVAHPTPSEFDVSSGGVVSSPFFPFICDPTISPAIMVKASLGKLADGTYNVVWDYLNLAKGTFAVVGGMLSSVYPPAVNGFWYDPAASGSGFNIEFAGVVGMLVVYYGWDASGNRLWLTSDFGPGSITPNVPITLNMSSTSGGTFAAPQHNVVAWGTLVLKFQDCRNASATLSGKDGTVNLNLSHLTSISGAPGC